jgi:hypothetical protein
VILLEIYDTYEETDSEEEYSEEDSEEISDAHK